MNTEREAFEAYQKSIGASTSKNKDGKYFSETANAAWMGWQAALENKPEAVPMACYTKTYGVQMLKAGFLADLPNDTLLYTTPPSTTALQKRIKELEAVISKKDEITELLEVTDMPLSDTNPDCLPSAILKNSGMPILNKDEISLLARFKETTEDDSSYDLSADELKILAQYGALKHKGGGYYSITEIGQWILNLSIKAGDVQAPKEGWISVEDTLPEENQRVLVYRIKNGYSVGNWFEHKSGENIWTIGGTTANRGSMEYPTHWMPLPAAPTDKEGK